MKNIRILTLILLVSFIVCSCTNRDKSFYKVDSKVTQSFSSLNNLDTFKIELTGTKSVDMVLHFTITNSQGKKIYATDINGTDIIKNTDPNVDLVDEKDQIKFLEAVADDFFGEDDFLEPAVLPEDVADNNVPDKHFYDQLKKTGLNGFKYRLGKETNLYIAWDNEAQKVKIYYKCC